jgi:hypothetical protein
MKEIEISFPIRILPKQTDVHWIEEELLRIRGGGFLRGIEEGVGGDRRRSAGGFEGV